MRAWNTLVFSRSRNRSKSQEWMPKLLTDEPNGRIWLSANHPNIVLKVRETIYDYFLHNYHQARQDFRNRLSVCAITKFTWEKLHKNLLQQLNQQAPSLLFVFSQLASLYNVLHLCIYLKENKGQHLGPMITRYLDNTHACCNKLVYYHLLNKIKNKSKY